MTAPEGLQFERAEFDQTPSVACAQCKTPLESSYYDVNGQTVCERCRYAIEAALTTGSSSGRVFRAIGAGVGAAIAGAILYYAVAAISGYEIGLIAIAVGYAVGVAVRWGSGGRGGRGYQVLAVALTYMAIVSTYIPPIVQGLIERSESEQSEQAASADNAATAATSQPSSSLSAPRSGPPAGALGLVTMIAILLAIAAVAPFLQGFENIIGIVIIAIGLWEAWKLTARAEVTITGPHAIAPAAVETAGV
jgi:hypothetical protein